MLILPNSGRNVPADPRMVPSFPLRYGTNELPQQSTVELERLYRKQRLAASYRLFARAGFDMGGAGHITARDPEFPDSFWVNPAGIHFSRIKVSELMRVDHAGDIVEPPATYAPLLNAAAFAIHSELHRARPDVVAAAHSHPLYGKAWSTLGRTLDPLTQDSAAFFENHAVFNDFTGVVLETDEGARIAEALGHRHAVILKNHGILTVGASVESAVWRYFSLENACQVQLLATSAGTPEPMRAEVARQTAAQLGSELAGFYSFKPYWDVIIEEEADLFD